MVEVALSRAPPGTDLRIVTTADCAPVDEGEGGTAWEIDLREKPAAIAGARRRPPKVLVAGPWAKVFGEWVHV
eukprot:gene979-41370_t